MKTLKNSPTLKKVKKLIFQHFPIFSGPGDPFKRVGHVLPFFFRRKSGPETNSKAISSNFPGFPHFFRFFYLFLAFSGFQTHVEVGSSSKGARLLTFSRAQGGGGFEIDCFWARKGVPPLCCQKVMTYTRSCVGKSFEIRRVTVLDFGAGLGRFYSQIVMEGDFIPKQLLREILISNSY